MLKAISPHLDELAVCFVLSNGVGEGGGGSNGAVLTFSVGVDGVSLVGGHRRRYLHHNIEDK